MIPRNVPIEELITRSENTSIMGDFDCKEVCQEDWSTKGGEKVKKKTSRSTLLKITMDDTIMQWNKANT